jgi:hypothetical protein
LKFQPFKMHVFRANIERMRWVRDSMEVYQILLLTAFGGWWTSSTRNPVIRTNSRSIISERESHFGSRCCNIPPTCYEKLSSQMSREWCLAMTSDGCDIALEMIIHRPMSQAKSFLDLWQSLRLLATNSSPSSW